MTDRRDAADREAGHLPHPVGVRASQLHAQRRLRLRLIDPVGARGDHHRRPHAAAEHDRLGDLRHGAAHRRRRIGRGARAGGELRDGVGMAGGQQCRSHALHRAAGFAGGHPISPRNGTSGALYPLAVLPGQVPVLRLQLARAGAHPAGPLPRRAAPRAGLGGGAARPPQADLDLLRRRHAQPDGAGDGGRADRRRAAACSSRPTISRSRWRPIRPASKPAASRRFATPG